MATRSVGAGNGWSWLKRAVNLGSHNPKALFGAAAIMLVLAMLPTFVQLLIQGAAPPSAASLGMQMVFSILYSVLVMPPAMAGFLRVIHASETGAPTHATAIFDGYRRGAGQVIALVLILMVSAIVVIGVLMFAFGGQFVSGIMEFMAQAQAASSAGVKPTVLPQLPDGFGTVVAVLVLFALFFNGVYALSVGQVALGSRSVGEALRDGFSGTIKNVLPLMVLLVIALVIGLLGGLVLALVMGVVAVIGNMVSPMVGMILLAPLYLLLMLAVYVVAFGVMYFMWRDICSDDVVSVPVPGDQVEV